MRPRPTTVLLLLVAPWAASACREGTALTPGTVSLSSAQAGTSGCNGSNQVFTPPQTPSQVALSVLSIGPFSSICATRNDADPSEEILFATGADGQVVQLDFSSGSLVETELAPPGDASAFIASSFGVVAPAELSGICVLSSFSLAVIEHTSNTLLIVSRTPDAVFPDNIFPLAGVGSAVPGFADGVDNTARFNFDLPGQVLPDGDGNIFVTDAGNHRVRQLQLQTGFFAVLTYSGNGIPQSVDSDDGSQFGESFDGPHGLAITCSGELLVTEGGSNEGHRLRSIRQDVNPFFGVLPFVETLAGDGTVMTAEGTGQNALLARPSNPVTTSDGDVYWVDTQTGVLRRYDFTSRVSDCPLNVDCPTAVGSPSFTPGGGHVSVAISNTGTLYVLDTAAGALYRLP